MAGPEQHAALLRLGHGGEVERALRPPSRSRTRPPATVNAAASPTLPDAQDLPTQLLARGLGRVAGHEGLARRRGLAGIERQVGVAGHQIDHRRPARPGHRRRSAPSPCSSPGRYRRATENSRTRPSRVMPISIADGFDSEVLPMPYHMAPMPTPRLVTADVRLKASASRTQRAPAGPSASRQAGNPALAASLCPVAVVEPGLERVAVAELQRIDAELLRQHRPSAPRARSPPAARRSRGRRRRADHWCRPRVSCRARPSPRTGPWRGPGTRLATVGPHEA